jgi:hypothetical protein
MPASGETARPALRRRSAKSAAARAPSSSTETKVLAPSPAGSAMAASDCSTSSRDVTQGPRARSSASCASFCIYPSIASFTFSTSCFSEKGLGMKE